MVTMLQPLDKRRFQHPFVFNPTGLVSSYEVEATLAYLDDHGGVHSFNLIAMRRRDAWAIELPLGVFTEQYGDNKPSLPDDLAARDKLLQLMRDKGGSIPFDQTRHIVHLDGHVFYRIEPIAAFRAWAPHNPIYQAAHKLLRLALEDPKVLLKPKPRRGTKVKDRPLVDGRRARGPSWSPREELVLKSWFGKWPDGKHHKLTEPQWETVLTSLDGFRSKQSVLTRLSFMNAQLKRTLMVDGYIPADRVKEYLAGFLGQRVQVPRFRPRLRGPYHA